MIESKVPKDIRKYKSKALGFLNLRQLICILIAFIVDFTIYFKFLKGADISEDFVILIMIGIAIPIMAFCLEPYGMKMEVYLKKVVYKQIFFPRKRRTRTRLNEELPRKTSAEMKQINKEYKERLKTDPSIKMYQ